MTSQSAQPTASTSAKSRAKLISMRDKKKFTDMTGNELFTLSNKMMAISKSFHGESPNGTANFEVKGKFKLMGSKSVITFKNAADGKDVELELNGDWLDKSANITLNGKPVAAISRKFFNASQFFGDKQTYFMTVAPNVDLSLMAAICVALDERENEK
ncbi:hypothetical protein LTR37_016142 [Vermiconidia calcicola]|uniref:Uncharacterized protein n=1 Tax=Vermiconidia calcicola TaxID=1690605 RepID=A0ACC3MNT5_9PEZI|nr:hypothetical protein LTR37_016142 [Vermiconidia calcicola]